MCRWLKASQLRKTAFYCRVRRIPSERQLRRSAFGAALGAINLIGNQLRSFSRVIGRLRERPAVLHLFGDHAWTLTFDTGCLYEVSACFPSCTVISIANNL